MVCKFNTWLMSINPSDINRFDWDDLRETIMCEVNDSDKADRLYENIDWIKTDISKVNDVVAKQVFDWMKSEINVFDGFEQEIPGFAIEYDGWYRHGLAGFHIDMAVSYIKKADVVKAIKALPKDKFDTYMEENHSSGSGFHSYIPNSRDGLLEQNDITYMMACYLGYRIAEKVAGMTFDNEFNGESCQFNDIVASPYVMGFDSSSAAYELIHFKEAE